MTLFVVLMAQGRSHTAPYGRVYMNNQVITITFYHWPSMLQFFKQKYMLFWNVQSIQCDNIDRSITVCSDRQTALKSIFPAKAISGLVWETMTKLQQLSINNCVRLLWVPGHSNIARNETAGKLCKTSCFINSYWTRTRSGIDYDEY